VDIRAADGHRFENEQHPAGEIRVSVLVPSDLPAQIVECDRPSEDFFNARRGAAENASDLLYRRPRVLSRRPLEHDQEVVIAFARDLVSAP